MSVDRHEKRRQEERRSPGSMKALDPLNRPQKRSRRFDRQPVATKPKGWGWA